MTDEELATMVPLLVRLVDPTKTLLLGGAGGAASGPTIVPLRVLLAPGGIGLAGTIVPLRVLVELLFVGAFVTLVAVAVS